MTNSQKPIWKCHKLDCTMELVLGENSNKKSEWAKPVGLF